jgi:iron complex outermembrane recepter protein
MKDSGKSRRAAIGALAPLGVLVTTSGFAQQPETNSLEEITVTARRVEEKLQDTPIAITVLTANALENRQIFATDALDQVVPNLQFSNNAPLAGNNASSQVFIRGIGQTDPTSTVDPGVGLYIDDVYMGSAVGGTMAFRDIANVQVLRGPQGTLFGRNTMGGAILLTTTAPGGEFGGTLRAGLGSDSLGEFFGAVDVPFSETLRSRFTFGLRKQDGYVKRNIGGEDLGDTNTWTGTGKLVFAPSEAFTATFNVDYTKADENGNPQVLAAINEAATFPRVASLDAGCPGLTDVANPMGIPDQPTPALNDPRCANAAQITGPYSNNGTWPLESLLESYGTSLKLEFNLSEALALKSISAWRGISWEGIRDADNTPLTILHTDYDVDAWQWSQELQLTYQSEKFTGVIGAYYFAQGSDDIVTVQLNTPAPGVQFDSDNNKVENKSWAAFTQWTWNFTENLGATLGARYSSEKKGSYPDQFDLALPNVKHLPVQWYEDDFTDFTPSASFNWRWNETGMLYVSYAKGFKGGGWNSHFNAPQTQTVLDAVHKFDQEEATTYEAGIKLDLLDRTLRLNLAAFTSDYTNLQITYRVVAAPYLANAGAASIDGAELELTWVPTADLSIDASIGVLDGKIDRLDINPVATPPPGLAAGNELPFAPDLQASLGIGYDIHAGSLLLTPRIDATYQDTTYFDAQNTMEIAQLDAYTVANVSFAIAPNDGPWRVLLGVNNATDEEYRIAGNSSLTTGSGYAEVAFARPRTWFGSFTYDF